jgi:hypothetical protein
VAEAVVPALLFIKYYKQFLPLFYQAKTHLNFSMRYKLQRYSTILFPVISRQQILVPVINYRAKEVFLYASRPKNPV